MAIDVNMGRTVKAVHRNVYVIAVLLDFKSSVMVCARKGAPAGYHVQ